MSLSPDTLLNASVLIQGTEGSYILIPLHRVNLKSKLVTGPVEVGIVPSLPMKGFSFLLGNDVEVSAYPIVYDEAYRMNILEFSRRVL